jgi:hypothetical protein
MFSHVLEQNKTRDRLIGYHEGVVCTLASSVPMEAMFSMSGLILNSKRSLMAPYHANMLSVVHDNCEETTLVIPRPVVFVLRLWFHDGVLLFQYKFEFQHFIS